MQQSKIATIREKCSIAWLWSLLGLPGKPGRNCCSPFREDKKASFSVYQAKDGERWHDHGDGAGGDVIDFFAKAKEITVSQAVDQLSGMLGEAVAPAASYKLAKEIVWPDDWRPPTELECDSLSMLRGLSADTFWTASLLGTLRVGTHYGELLWWITDEAKKGAEGRTFGGESCIASGKKTVTLAGSSKSDWPYGLMTSNQSLNEVPNILVVEGMPDYYAALSLAIASDVNFLPVTILGWSCNFGDEAGNLLRGKKIVIIPHNDEKGVTSVERWKKSLVDYHVGWVQIEPLPDEFKDLNEYVSVGNKDVDQLLKEFEQ